MSVVKLFLLLELMFLPSSRVFAADSQRSCHVLSFLNNKYLIGVLAETQSGAKVFSLAHLTTRSHEDLYLDILKKYDAPKFLWAGELLFEAGKLSEANETSGFFWSKRGSKRVDIRIAHLQSFMNKSLRSWLNKETKFSSYDLDQPHLAFRGYDAHSVRSTQQALLMELDSLVQIKKNGPIVVGNKVYDEARSKEGFRASKDLLHSHSNWIRALAREKVIEQELMNRALLSLDKIQGPDEMNAGEIELFVESLRTIGKLSNNQIINPINYIEFE